MSKHNLKLWFVPHPDNKHHPHLLKFPALLTGLALIVLVQLIFNYAVTGNPLVLGFATNINAKQVITATNQQRLNDNLPMLSDNTLLDKAAQLKANDMIARDYWAHTAPDGTSPWSFFDKVGYNYNFAGENLAKDFNTSNGVVSGWMASPKHRDNILNTKYTDIGVATANGVIDGQETTVVVALYGSQPSSLLAETHLLPTASASAQGITNAPSSRVSFSLIHPLPFLKTLDLAQIAIVALLLFFIVIYFNDHRIKLKYKLITNKHSHSILQASLLCLAVVLIIVKSFGAIN